MSRVDDYGKHLDIDLEQANEWLGDHGEKVFTIWKTRDPQAFQGLEDPTFNGLIAVNAEGAAQLNEPQGKLWISFTYHDTQADPVSPFYGVVCPDTGEVIATGSEVNHWFG